MKTKIIIFACLIIFSLSSAQVGINTENPDPSSVLDITSDNKGVLLPRITLTSLSQQLSSSTNATSLLIYNTGSQNVPKGFYSWSGAAWIPLTAAPSASAASKYFYMPSIILPTNSNDALIGTGEAADYTYDNTNQIYKVKTYKLFNKKFTSPVAASSTTTANLSEFVQNASDYDYYVISVDSNVFTNVSIDADGILTYKINSNAIIRNGSFMNIVLRVR
ncbi:hypothetical protein [Chryseobacterium sp. T1]